MKVLLDVCVSSRALEAALYADGHDVLSAAAFAPTATDEALLRQGVAEERVLITADKDFGELVFVRHLPHGPIVRLVELSVDQQVQAMRELMDYHAADLTGPIIVTITRGRIRMRRP